MDFRLEDGRHLGEVMGPDFFGPESRVVMEEKREKLREGNYPLAQIIRKYPEKYAPRPKMDLLDRDGADVSAAQRRDGPRQQQRAEWELRALEMERAEKDKVREEARKKLPGVGRPFSIQEAYDRVDAGETFGQMDLDPVYRPDGVTPVDYFAAKVEEYIGGSREDRTRLRSEVTFDRTLEEVLRTEDNFQIYLGNFDKRGDVHND